MTLLSALDKQAIRSESPFGPPPANWGRVRVFSFAKERKEFAIDESNNLLSISEYFGVAPRSEKFSDSEGGSREGSTVGYRIVYEDDFAMNYMLAWKGAQGVSSCKGVVSPAYAVFELDQSLVAPRFIHHLFRSRVYQDYFKSLSRGIMDSRLRLYPEVLLHLSIYIPARNEQQTIADYLDEETAKIDNLISKQERLLELLEEKRRAIITHVVTRGLNSSVEYNDVHVAWIAEIPEHWKINKLKNLYVASNAGEVIPKEYWDPEGKELTYTASQNPVQTTFETFPGKKRTTADDILLARNGDGVIHNPVEGSIYTNVVQRIRINKEVNKHFLIYALNAALDFIHDQSNGDFIVSLNMGIWNNSWLPIPPIDEQTDIAKYLDDQALKIESLKQKIVNQIFLLKERRLSLISNVVTGKVKV